MNNKARKIPPYSASNKRITRDDLLGRQKNAVDLVNGITGRVPNEKRVITKDGGGSVSVSTQTVVKLRTMPVAWGIPLDETLFARFFVNFLNLRIMPWDDLITTTSTYISEARNTIHQDFVTKSTCEYLVMLDSDVLPPPDFLQRLLDHKLPIVGGWYKKKGDPYPPCVYDFGNEDGGGVAWWKVREQAGVGLEKVDGAGAGCWLMRREVAEALGERPYNPHVLSEDFLLCRKLADLKIDVYIDWSIACAHAGVAYV